MKIRSGFVSNSSSTAFMFVTKGDSIDNLQEQVLKYCSNRFAHMDSYDSDRTFDVYDVVREMKEVYSSCKDSNYHEVGKFQPIDGFIEKLEKDASWCEDQLEKEEREEKKSKPSYSFVDYYRKQIGVTRERAQELREAKERGFTHVFTVDFGNDGMVDGEVGDAVRGNGNRIMTVDKDLIVFNEEWS